MRDDSPQSMHSFLPVCRCKQAVVHLPMTKKVTSDMKEKKNLIRRNSVRYVMIAAFCVVFAAVYGHFSHEISYVWMSTLFVWPLTLGGLPALLQELGILPVFEVRPKATESGQAAGTDVQNDSLCMGNIQADLWRFGIAALTAAELLKGILEIAGTDSVYPDFLQAGGGLMLAVAAVLYLMLLRAKHEKL